MQYFREKITWFAGLAIFSMFFGAGNIIYPIQLGVNTSQQVFWGLVGLLITAIGGPLLGLAGCLIYQGNIWNFFKKLGIFPACIMIGMCILLLGPLAVMPRCILVSHAAIGQYFPTMSINIYCVFSCICIYIAIFFKHQLLNILGGILSPLLLLSLITIIVGGLYLEPTFSTNDNSVSNTILLGLAAGYDTMDLIAAIFFSSTIWSLLQTKKTNNITTTLKYSIAASVLGGGLLALVYIGLAVIAAQQSSVLHGVPTEHLLTKISSLVLGDKFSIVTNITVTLACLTTVMSLTVTMAHLLVLFIPRLKNYYYLNTAVILLITALCSANLSFATIMHYLHPVLNILYPATIVLTCANLLSYYTGWQKVYWPVWIVVLSLFYPTG